MPDSERFPGERDGVIAGYVFAGGANCPWCEEDNARIAKLAPEQFVNARDERFLLMPCYCAACRKMWVETYRLVDVNEDRDLAIIAAQSNPGPKG